MEQLRMKLTELRPPERNVRIHTARQLKEFERSVKMFGQIRPIVVDENNVILAGCGLYETLTNMGITEADVYKFTDLSENQKKKLMIADNKIFNLGVENIDTLNTFIEEMADDLDIPGYDQEILEQMVADADEVTEHLSTYGTITQEEADTIREKGAKPIETRLPTPRAPKDTPPNTEAAPEVTDDDATYIVCPKCGERIRLGN